MDKQQFEFSVKIFNQLGESRLKSGRTLREELCLGQEISFWDILAPYLVLYRFPLLFLKNNQNFTVKEWWKYYLRPFRGRVAQFMDSAIFYFCRNVKDCLRWPAGRQPVLFLAFTQTFYRDVLHPVTEFFIKKDSRQVVVLEHNRSLPDNFSPDSKIEFQSLCGHWGIEANNLGKNLLERLKALQKSLLNKNQLMVLTQSVSGDFSKFALRQEFYWIFWRELRRLIPMYAVAKHILEEHKPALIVSADDADQRHRIFSLLARKKGIPALLVQQGLCHKDYPEWLFFSHTMVAAMGQASADDMISQGVPPEKIMVTGNPGFDQFSFIEPEAVAFLRKRLGVLDNEKMVLFACQPYYVGVFNTPQIRSQMIEAIAQAAGSLKNIKLVVKPHPADNVRQLKKLLDKSPQAVMVDRKMDISPLIKACDVLVTFFSTAALQALYAGKPVINVEFPDSSGNNIYSESGATRVARSTGEIIKCLQDLIQYRVEDPGYETNRQLFLRKMLHFPDGLASERVLKVVAEMLSS
ncbi:MAG: CDP-glycerol glycerophosphotransferase family protein [Candidatus Omnitrophica bacterium]|nr:CDP-glycerol glycerophosphotransferase family protein [Candidatus Omnitrophota bacterium]